MYFVPKLNIYDNNIRAAGAQAIAHALTKNTLLTKLNLRLNRLGDEGGQAICRSLLKNATLSDLNLGSNELSEPTAAMLSQVVVQNTTLRNIELSCNRLGTVRIRYTMWCCRLLVDRGFVSRKSQHVGKPTSLRYVVDKTAHIYNIIMSTLR